MNFSEHATEASKEVLKDFARSPCADSDLRYIEALAGSNDLHLALRSAELSDHQLEGFLALAFALNMDYSFFRKELADAQVAQKQVSDAATLLLKALERLGRYSFIRPELRYAHSFLAWAGVSSVPHGGLDSLLSLASLIENLKGLATDERPAQTDFTAVAISSQKASAPHELTRALLYLTPTELQRRLCPAIAEVVSLVHPAGMTTQDVRRLLKDLSHKLT